MKIKNLTKVISDKVSSFSAQKSKIIDKSHYKPTPYLMHPFLQSVYNITERQFPFEFKR